MTGLPRWTVLGLGIAAALLAALTLAPPGSARAAEAAAETKGLRESLALDASLRGSAWSSDRELTNDPPVGAGTLWLRMAPALSQSVTLKVEGWASSQPATTYGKDAAPVTELREAYLAYLGDKLEVRAGRQIVVWGRADRLNPTDNLTSRDFRLLYPEDDDQRRGSGMVQVTYPLAGFTANVYWLPEFRPNVFATPKLPAGVSFGDDEKVNEPGQGAIRIDRSGGAVDFSLSYFEGRDRNPDVALDHISAAGAVLQRRYGHVRTVGADAATTVGRFGLRAEIAETRTEDLQGDDPAVKNGYLYAVAGADRTFFEYLSVNAQVIYRQTDRWRDPHADPNPLSRSLAVQNAVFSQQLHRIENGASLRISYQFLNETLTVELAAVQFFQDGDSVLAPKVTWKATDTLRLTAGSQQFSGPDESFFGAQKKNSTSYLEVRWGY